MALLQVQHISKKIDERIIVDDISFEQDALQKIAIAGESGAGKSTLLKMFSGHEQPTSGKIFFEGKRIIGPEEKLLPGHQHIGYLSQHYELLNNYRVEELVWFDNKLEETDIKQLLEICRIDHLLQRKTNYLSGGEKQRIALCLLLTKHPKLLVLDEPFSNLDPNHTNILKEVLNEIAERLKITCTLTSHDPHDTLSWADEIIVMRNGKIIQQGKPQDLYHKPVNEYVAGLFGKYNLLPPSTAALFGIHSNGNSVMTRPENFRIYKTGSGVNATVQAVNFYGGHYEVEVLVGDTKIITRSDSMEWNVQDKIFIALH